MNLWQIAVRQSAQIIGIDQDLSAGVTSRLREMGFDPGQAIHCLRRAPLNGPLVVRLGDSIFSLEQTIAERINITSA